MIYDDLEIEDKIEDIPVQNLLAVVENSKVKDFLLAGNCRCNIENLKTGNRFTYKIKRSKDVKHMYFVYVESGLGDIYGGYFYVNANVFDYRKGEKGKLDIEDVRIKALLYVLNKAPHLPSNVIVEHTGHCGRCDGKLDDLDSIKCGICSLCRETLENIKNK